MTESSLLNDEYATLIEIDFDEDYVNGLVGFVQYRRNDRLEQLMARNTQGSFDHGYDNETIFMFGDSIEPYTIIGDSGIPRDSHRLG